MFRSLRYLFLFVFSMFVIVPAHAGLDLENQEEIYVPDFDLDNDGRIIREEIAKYVFFYFDRDGNESLTKGEYHKRRPMTVLPYEADAAPFVDLDNDGEDDGVIYDTESFVKAFMVDAEEYDPEADGIKAYELMDLYFLRIDTDKSRAVELDEWQKHYKKFANRRGNIAPKAFDQDSYTK